MADAQGNRYGPYDIEIAAGSEAEAFTEDAWYLMNRESGVISGGGLTFTGLTAHLAAVELRSHGSFLAREAEWTDASPVTTGAAPRRDLLVARRQLTVGSGESAVPGKTFLTVLRGTPASTPANPAHDPANDELLWSWQVPGGGGSVVTDVRDHRFILDGAWRVYTPTWTVPGASIQPTIGNGTLAGRYRRRDRNSGDFKIQLTLGSTTGGGNGTSSQPYQFSLPPGWVHGPQSAAIAGYFLSAVDTGGLTAFVSSGDTKVYEIRANQNNSLVGNGLLTVAGNYIILSGTIELA